MTAVVFEHAGDPAADDHAHDVLELLAQLLQLRLFGADESPFQVGEAALDSEHHQDLVDRYSHRGLADL